MNILKPVITKAIFSGLMLFVCAASLAAPFPTGSFVSSAADKGPRPMEVVLQCLDALLKNDDLRLRGFMTDNAQAVLAGLATNDASAYDEIRNVLSSGHPLTKLAQSGVKSDVVTSAGGERKALLQSGGRIIGQITFNETAQENLSLIEVRVAQFEDTPAMMIFQVVLVRNEKKKDKPWQISAFYEITQGGRLDDYFNQDNLTTVRIASNEATIIQAMRKLAQSQTRYLIGPGQNKNYGTLDLLRRAGEIGTDLAGGKYRGYVIEAILDNTSRPPEFSIYAVPQQYGKTGKRSFVIDQNATLYGADRRGDRATLNDPVIPSADDAQDE